MWDHSRERHLRNSEAYDTKNHGIVRFNKLRSACALKVVHVYLKYNTCVPTNNTSTLTATDNERTLQQPSRHSSVYKC